MTAPIAIIMGSQSDWETMRHAAETLTALGIDCEKRIVSAHRTPDRLFAFAKGAKAKASGHHRRRRRRSPSPGMAAALTELPVFGVPSNPRRCRVDLAVLDRADAGRRSRRHAGDRQGRRHQRRAAASVLALNDAALAARLAAWRKQQTEAVKERLEGSA